MQFKMYNKLHHNIPYILNLANLKTADLNLAIAHRALLLVVTVAVNKATILYLGRTNRNRDTEISIIPNI